MNCKFCNAELEEGVTLCPECGKDNAESEKKSAPADKKDTTVIMMTKSQLWQLIAGITAAVALLAALAVVLIGGINFDWAKQGEKEKQDAAASDSGNKTEDDGFVPFDNGVSYTVSDKDAVAAASDVVATMGGKTLTNGALRLYYYMQVTNFVNTNYNYLSTMGLDYTKPLDQQKCYYDEKLTWQQYFVNQSIETWSNYQGIGLLAEASGYKPDGELQEQLDSLKENIEAQIKTEGYDSGEKWIQELVGTGCTFEDFLAYSRLYYIGADYTNIKPTAAQIEAYFEEHKDEFADNDITKESGPMVDVRHILICPNGGTTDANNVTTYSEAEWAECLKEAEAVLAQWKAGKATEETFAELASKLSEDGGSNTSGGLYTGITAETNFVKPFLDWSMDKSRKVGDTDIVKTDYGYHIMYFSKTQQIWAYYAEVSYISENTTATMQKAKEEYPVELTLDNVKLAALSLGA